MGDLLDEAYAALTSAVGELGDGDGWTPTGCTGWAAHDLVWHLHADAQRALVAAHTPAGQAADCDAVEYWRAWGSDPAADDRTRRMTRVEAGLHPFASVRDRYLEAAAAARRAVSALRPDEVLLTQGHAIRADDLASTLAVEATLHHLDLTAGSGPGRGPTPAGLGEVRRVVVALLGQDLPGWSDTRVAMVGTGRAAPTTDERAALVGATLPVFS